MNVRKVASMALIFITVWFGAKSFLLSVGCGEEVLSIKDFQFEIVGVQVQDNDTLKVALEFKNPSSKGIEILRIICSVIWDEYFIGSDRRDLSDSPILLEKSSEHAEEAFITNRIIQNYVGKEVEVQVYAQVTIKMTYLRGITIKATYVANVALQ